MPNIFGGGNDDPIAPYSTDFLIVKRQDEEQFIKQEQSCND